MEFEFDKEIDALLRKAGSSGAATAPVFDSHLDADEISMFAENATPEAARSRTIRHFADCDRCRMVLSNLVLLNAENPVTVSSAAAVPLEIGDEKKTSWLTGLFSTRNLAFGFGALGLLFAGFIGIGVIRNMSSGETQLAKADQTEFSTAEPVQEATVSNSNTADLAAAAPESSSNNAVEPAREVLGGSDQTLTLPQSEAVTGKDVARRRENEQDGFADSRRDIGRLGAKNNKQDEYKAQEELSDASAASEAQSAPPPPAPSSKSSVLASRGAAVKKKETVKEDANDEKAENRIAADSVSEAGEGGSIRQVSGKSFTKRNGIWFDSAYKNQPTTNIRRGTNNYRSLDAGVRSIANELAGTVVVVWKTKAYKIQ